MFCIRWFGRERGEASAKRTTWRDKLLHSLAFATGCLVGDGESRPNVFSTS